MRAVRRRLAGLVIVAIVVSLQSGARSPRARVDPMGGRPSSSEAWMPRRVALGDSVVLVVNGDEPTDDDRLSLKESRTGGPVIDAPADLGDLSRVEVTDCRAADTAPVHEVDHEP
jgi:hypothetical protein